MSCAEEGVGAPGDELVDHGVIDYESDIGQGWLGHEEAWRAPLCGLADVHQLDDIAVDEPPQGDC